MSLLFDQNLSRRLPGLLAVEFPGCEKALLAGLATADDRAVWAYASARGLAVVSKDADFVAISALLGPPPKRKRQGGGAVVFHLQIRLRLQHRKLSSGTS